MATEQDENVFSSPWNDSDIVLIVEEKEVHVHKLFLTSQSPVFKAMFQEGHFEEASQGKITLKEKEYKSMVRFLKILYPTCMFGEARESFDGENLLSILKLADEYQCVNVIKQCIDEAKITEKNSMQILPYAMQYHKRALPGMFDILMWSASTAKLEKILPELDSKEDTNKMLLTKCRFLESTIVKLQGAVISLIYDFLRQQRKALKSDPMKTTDSRCNHTICVRDISMTKGCVHCMKKYKEEFVVPIPSCTGAMSDSFIKMLHEGHDIVTHCI